MGDKCEHTGKKKKKKKFSQQPLEPEFHNLQVLEVANLGWKNGSVLKRVDVKNKLNQEKKAGKKIYI